MSDSHVNLAVETSSKQGSVALGRGDELLAAVALEQHRRHNVELMPMIERLFEEHSLKPRDLREVYVSIGPGSFTGLRVAVATAKMLAMTLDCRIVAVPTVKVLSRNVIAPPPGSDGEDSAGQLAVAVNLKKEAMYTALFDWQGGDDMWQLSDNPNLLTVAQTLDQARRPLAYLATDWPKGSDALIAEASNVTALPVDLATPRAEAAWHLGRAMAKAEEFTDAYALTPLYVRPPDAVEAFEQRQRKLR